MQLSNNIRDRKRKGQAPFAWLKEESRFKSIPPKGRIRSPMPVREARRYRDSLVQSGPVILETLRSHMRSGEPVTIVRRRARQLREFTVFGIGVDCIDESNSMISLTDRNHSYTFLAQSVRLRDIKRVYVDDYDLRRNALRELTEQAQELGLYDAIERDLSDRS